MSRRERARAFRRKIEANLNATRKLIRVDEISEEELNDMIDLYEPWGVGMVFTDKEVGTLINYEGQLYKILQPHTTQGDWLPPDAKALYGPVQPKEVIGEWDFERDYAANPIQPGEKVIWTDGKVYESIHPSPHAWTPTDYPQAWKEIK